MYMGRLDGWPGGLLHLIAMMLLSILWIQRNSVFAVQNDLRSMMQRSKNHPHQPILKDDDNSNSRGRPAGELMKKTFFFCFLLFSFYHKFTLIFS